MLIVTHVFVLRLALLSYVPPWVRTTLHSLLLKQTEDRGNMSPRFLVFQLQDGMDVPMETVGSCIISDSIALSVVCLTNCVSTKRGFLWVWSGNHCFFRVKAFELDAELGGHPTAIWTGAAGLHLYHRGTLKEGLNSVISNKQNEFREEKHQTWYRESMKMGKKKKKGESYIDLCSSRRV